MIINVEKLKVEVDRFNQLLNKYEEIKFNLYNIINSSGLYWNDENSVRFFDNNELEKRHVDKFLIELEDIKSIYQFIIINYENLGINIRCDLSLKSEIIDCFNRYIKELDEIIKLYNDIDFNIYSEEANILRNQQIKLVNSRNNAIQLKKIVLKILKEIEDIELEINNKLNKMDIEFLKDENIQSYI